MKTKRRIKTRYFLAITWAPDVVAHLAAQSWSWTHILEEFDNWKNHIEIMSFTSARDRVMYCRGVDYCKCPDKVAFKAIRALPQQLDRNKIICHK